MTDGFREVTYIAEDEEVYVQEQDDGTILDVYTDPDSELVAETSDRMTWETQGNSMFVHASDPAGAVDYMDKHRWIRTDD